MIEEVELLDLPPINNPLKEDLPSNIHDPHLHPFFKSAVFSIDVTEMFFYLKTQSYKHFLLPFAQSYKSHLLQA